MSRKFLGIMLCVLAGCLALPGFAQAKDRHDDQPFSTSWAVYSLDQAGRNESGLAAQRLAVLFIEPDAGWYTYANDPGGFGKPTKLTVSLGGTQLQVLYPAGTPKPDPLDPSALVNAYVGRTPLFVPLPDEPAKGGRAQTLESSLELLLCAKDKCLPVSQGLNFTLPQGAGPDARSQDWWQTLRAAAKRVPKAEVELTPTPAAPVEAAPVSVDGWSGLKPRYHQPDLEVGGLLKAVLLGLLAGFILNFMPCVLPVISIKLSGLMAGSAQSAPAAREAKFREHNLFFALGILLYFFLLSAVLGATGLAWGQIFQKAEIVLGLTALIFALSLSLYGVFSLPIVDLKFDQMTAHPKLQALFTGLLATLLATPCSGPFLGGVLGWTLLQPPWVISSVLAAIGTGMALPYLVMTLFPGLVRLFPKPGAWTGHLEKLVGLLLMGTCIYLLGILPDAKLIPALLLLWFTAMAAWLWGVAGPGFDSRRLVLLKLLALGLLACGLVIALRPAQVLTRLDHYSEASLRAALGKETVVVDFTADWCPSCKVLEQTTLTPTRLGDMKTRYGLRLMQADLTEKNPEAEALLHALGSKSIPVLAIFSKNDPNSPLVLRDLFTPTQLEDALKHATSR